MADCAKCGAPIAAGSAFCGSCGQPVSVPAETGSMAASPPASGATAGSVALTMNLAAALSYALGLITGILFLVLDPYKNNRLVRFHAIQSILFSAACIAFAIVWSILVGLLVSIAGFWVLTIDVPLRLLIGLAIFLFWLYLMFQAYSEREYHIPWLGDIAAKQAR